MMECKSGILYVRAGLAPLAKQIKADKSVINLLHNRLVFDELIVPYFHGARPFWRAPVRIGEPYKTNSGSLGRLVSGMPDSVISRHPTHAFAGFGNRVAEALNRHTADTPCFFPIKELAERFDFSMLLIGCVDESPGFSTVHGAQTMLGLSQKHLIRYLLRWDVVDGKRTYSRIAPEAPGCSTSFDKFYPLYQKEDNLLRGEWGGVSWIFIPSALKALQIELSVLREKPRFVKCEKTFCPTCSVRLY